MNFRNVQDTSPVVYFLPTSMQYRPLDDLCIKIVNALMKRNWTFPGIEIEMHEVKNKDLIARQVRQINGNNFKLYFSRKEGDEGMMFGFNSCPGIHTIKIPKRELTVYNDESGPTYKIYSGDNWKRDKAQFMGKSNFQNGLYHYYTGSFEKNDHGTIYVGKRAPYLVARDQHGEEHYPKIENGEPLSFNTQYILNEFTDYLKINLLDPLEKATA